MAFRTGSGMNPYYIPNQFINRVTPVDANGDPGDHGSLAESITKAAQSTMHPTNSPMTTIATGVYAHENNMDPEQIAEVIDWLRLKRETTLTPMIDMVNRADGL